MSLPGNSDAIAFIERASDIIKSDGWIKGAYARSEEPDGSLGYCSLGVFRRVIFGEGGMWNVPFDCNGEPFDDWNDTHSSPEMRDLYNLVIRTYSDQLELPDVMAKELPHVRIVQWNDEISDGPEDVLLAMKKTVRALEES